MEELEIITERVDDVPLLLGVMKRIGLVEILDHHIPPHWKQRELSWGWTAVIWLAYILTEGDHRKSSVEEYIRGMQNTFNELTGQEVSEADFTTDRLGNLLKYLSQTSYWKALEQELNERSIEVYELPTEVVRCDATTVSRYHEGGEGSLFQFGHSKDDPSLRQIKLMTGALDPLGMPLVTDVVSGERADEGLYIPVIDRVHEALQKTGVLYCGDCKISALETRTHIIGLGHHYLSPLPLTGKTAEKMGVWTQEGIVQKNNGDLQEVFRMNDQGQEVLIAQGYEFQRPQQGMDGDKKLQWSERVFILQSPTHASQQKKGLEQRIEKAQKKLLALTPPIGQSKRQITEETVLKTQIEKILKTHKVEGLLEINYEKQMEQQTKYIGKGRGSMNRPTQVIETIRYQITAVKRLEEQIEQTKETFGWKAFVIDVTQEHLSLEQAVLCYRKEYRVERIFERLKSRLNIAPLFVQRDDQVEGLTHLLILGIRVLTLIEFVIRRSLQQDKAALTGWQPGKPKQTTEAPTVERILKAFSNVSLTIIHSGNQLVRHLTPLSELQKEILERLGFERGLYQNLEIKNSAILLTKW
ncbi:IS1634 family transposase [Deltaproteobacteria bacterium TL4]